MVIENQYIQTSFMVALSLFRGKEEGGAHVYKSEVDTIWRRFQSHPYGTSAVLVSEIGQFLGDKTPQEKERFWKPFKRNPRSRKCQKQKYKCNLHIST